MHRECHQHTKQVRGAGCRHEARSSATVLPWQHVLSMRSIGLTLQHRFATHCYMPCGGRTACCLHSAGVRLCVWGARSSAARRQRCGRRATCGACFCRVWKRRGCRQAQAGACGTGGGGSGWQPHYCSAHSCRCGACQCEGRAGRDGVSGAAVPKGCTRSPRGREAAQHVRPTRGVISQQSGR